MQIYMIDNTTNSAFIPLNPDLFIQLYVTLSKRMIVFNLKMSPTQVNHESDKIGLEKSIGKPQI